MNTPLIDLDIRLFSGILYGGKSTALSYLVPQWTGSRARVKAFFMYTTLGA